MAHTAAQRHEVFERLAWNGGNVYATAKECDVTRQTIAKWMKQYASEYEDVITETRKAFLTRVLADRELALDALRECILVKRALLRDEKHKARVRVSDIARGVETLDRIAQLQAGGPTERTEHTIKGIEEIVMDIRRKRGLDVPALPPEEKPSSDQPN